MGFLSFRGKDATDLHPDAVSKTEFRHDSVNPKVVKYYKDKAMAYRYNAVMEAGRVSFTTKCRSSLQRTVFKSIFITPTFHFNKDV